MDKWEALSKKLTEEYDQRVIARESSITLDGTFTLAQLERIIAVIKKVAAGTD